MPTVTVRAVIDRDLTIHELAARWGVSVATVRRRIEDGTVSSYKLGPSLVRITAASVHAAESTGGPPAPDSVVDAIRLLVDSAPPLTDEQRARLAGLLSPYAGGDAA